MRLAPGQIGLMSFRGSNFINIGTERPGVPSCVLIRAVRIGEELYDGPGKVGEALNGRGLEYKVIGDDITVTGKTKPSYYSCPLESAENSLGRYRLRD